MLKKIRKFAQDRSFSFSGVDEECSTHTHHQGICSKPGSMSEVYANWRNEPSPGGLPNHSILEAISR